LVFLNFALFLFKTTRVALSAFFTTALARSLELVTTSVESPQNLWFKSVFLRRQHASSWRKKQSTSYPCTWGYFIFLYRGASSIN